MKRLIKIFDMKIASKLSNPVVYRRLFVAGFFIFGIGAVLENIILTTIAIFIIMLSKYGMRKEHKEKVIFKDEIYSTDKKIIND